MSPRWTKPEVDYITDHAGEVPFHILCERFRQQWPHRSPRSIRDQLRRRGITVRLSDGNWLTTAGAAAILGISPERAYRMCRNPKVRMLLNPSKAPSCHTSYSTRGRWRSLAKRMPWVFGGIDPDRLYALIEDRELADDIARRHPFNGRDYRVRCVETGQVWPSCVHAARELHVDPATIPMAIRRGRPVRSLGMTFELLRRPFLP